MKMLLGKLVNGFKRRKQKPARAKALLGKIGRFRIRCNLCDQVFQATSHFLRFCRTCRIENETYRFAETL